VADDADGDLPAGDFSSWLADFQAALADGRDADVPCAGCTACCTSGQFIHIAPDETDTLAHIPAALVFQAPRLPVGHVVLGHDEHGRCPMLGDGGCTIYEHRPRTCRTYDCRVFAATGVALDDDQPTLAARVARWSFTHPTPADRHRHDALRAAAAFIGKDAELSAETSLPRSPSGVAVLAVEVHDAFLGGEAVVVIRDRVRKSVRQRRGA
jgi:hypothetical protein